VPTTLVHDVDLTIGRKECIAITGPSGSGKSSLLYLLGLLDLPTVGEVRIRGRATAHMEEAERAHARLSTLGFVFQFHFLLPEFSALENVMLPMKALGGLSREVMRTVVAVTHDVDIARRMDRHILLQDGGIMSDSGKGR
jgi:lipoprotein-releasing system ATP-binding protein